jgi:hypothetical protein
MLDNFMYVQRYYGNSDWKNSSKWWFMKHIKFNMVECAISSHVASHHTVYLFLHWYILTTQVHTTYTVLAL